MSEPSEASKPWDIQAARSLYNIDRWGARYFDINEAGHVVATPLQEAGAVAVRLRSGEDLKSKTLEEFMELAAAAVTSLK
jgi:arginine decarboxylase